MATLSIKINKILRDKLFSYLVIVRSFSPTHKFPIQYLFPKKLTQKLNINYKCFFWLGGF